MSNEYSQGIAHDGAAILKDGQPMTIDEIVGELRLLAAAQAEARELRAEVYEWLCEACNTVYPGPPLPGLLCISCPTCGGNTGPRLAVEVKRLRAELEEANKLRSLLHTFAVNVNSLGALDAASQLILDMKAFAALSQPAEPLVGVTESGHYCYWDSAEHSQHGLMQCANCHKPITSGEYRLRERADRYVTWHRECCEDDPHWEERDALTQPAEPTTLDSALPLMARRDGMMLHQRGVAGGVIYRIADTDEHGLPVIERTAEMPEGAKYRFRDLRTEGPWRFDERYRPMAIEEWQRIEDYNAHAEPAQREGS